MNFGAHPLILIAVFGALAALGAIVIACRAKSGLVAAVMVVLALVFIAPAGCVLAAFHPELVDGRFRTYKKFHSDIRVGMTREQVLAAMEQRYPTNGPRKRPKIMDSQRREFASVRALCSNIAGPEDGRTPLLHNYG